ncbi:MAG: hypothetical protein AYK19_21230 [Theionarchaea archaeon DG-70-1]|nr:MAG: hypothetical protein AYK19_21230 [Theionarchaea archaeon DG-70-1]
MIDYGFRTECIRVRELPSFVRVTLKGSARKELFFHSIKKMEIIKRYYDISQDVFDTLYGKKRGTILQLLSKNPQTARKLIEDSGLKPSTVYHFLKDLRERHRVSRKGRTYYLEEHDSGYLFLNEIVKLEEDSALRRKYGVSMKELELAYFLWDTFVEVAPEERTYAQTCQNEYTLADAVHRWRTGRTDIPVWALARLAELSESDILQIESVTQYHLPPGIPVIPYYDGEYKLPIQVDSELDKIVIQLLLKMSKNHLYTFPKRKQWLFEKLHKIFGEFDDSTSRIPSAVIEILKFYYGVKTLERSSACIPSHIKARWSELTPLSKIAEESSLLLHIISLSSRFNGGFEITSRSRSFLEEISYLTSSLGTEALNVRKKHGRPHFRVYLSESKVDVLRRYAHLFQEYPDLEIWSRIPLNRIAEKMILTDADSESIELICCEELSRFVESILRSLKRKGFFHGERDYLQYKEEITDYFWEQKLIPSPRSVEKLVEVRIDKEENLLYA